MTGSRLGIITIGQSPRVDMVPEMLPWLGIDSSRVVERGALDGLSPDRIGALAPPERRAHSGTAATSESGAQPAVGDVLTTRMADGSSVVVEHDGVVELLGQAVRWLEDEAQVDASLIVCSSEFPPIPHRWPLLFAEPLFTSGVRGIVSRNEPLGVVCPLPEQVRMLGSKWRSAVREVSLEPATPYQEQAVERVAEAAATLASGGSTTVVLDCMGYTAPMKRAAARAAGVPVLLAREVVARLAGAVIG